MSPVCPGAVASRRYPIGMQALFEFAALVRLRRDKPRRAIVVPSKPPHDADAPPAEQSPALPWWFDQALA